MDHEKAKKVSFLISSIASLEGMEKMVKVSMEVEVPLIFSISMKEDHLHRVVQKCTNEGIRDMLERLIRATIGDSVDDMETSINELKDYADEYVDQA